MERAVTLGRDGNGQVHPNPEVGCVIVQGDTVVGEGYHARIGGPHAEVVALNAAGERARGATAYVSLEPCGHQGKTPPCTQALIAAGVSRVVFGNSDPTNEAAGGASQLVSAGVEVTGPLLTADEGRLANPSFFHWAERGTTWLQIKLALSVDGRISAVQGARTAISGAEAGAWVQTLRAGVDAILVGSTTAVVDDPRLTVRGDVECVRPPARVVLDSQARISPAAALFTHEGGPVHICVRDDAPNARLSALQDSGATIHRFDAADENRVGLPLPSVMETLAKVGFRSVLCEGGGVLASALIRDGFAQRIHLIVAPVSLGEQAVPAFTDALTLDGESWRAFDASRACGAPRTLGRDALVSFRQDY